jgi:hypothetical protein
MSQVLEIPVVEAVQVLAFVSSVAGLHCWIAALIRGDLDISASRVARKPRVDLELHPGLSYSPSDSFDNTRELPLLRDLQTLRSGTLPLAGRLAEPALVLQPVAIPPAELRRLVKASAPTGGASNSSIRLTTLDRSGLREGWVPVQRLEEITGLRVRALPLRLPAVKTRPAASGERVLLKATAFRTTFFRRYDHCKLVLTTHRLTFENEQHRAHNFEIARQHIHHIQLLAKLERLNIGTAGGKMYRIEASPRILKQILEEVRG